MSILDQVTQALGGATSGSGGGQSALLQAALHMLSQNTSDGTTGLASLVETFHTKGLGEIVSSWISTGSNLPISAEQIQKVLGNEQLRQFAGKAGLSPEAASTHLANLLPSLVDKLTPHGQIPEGSLLEQGLNLLRGKQS